ncbi:Receptor-type tyrosine-protein phosphatase F [Halotydeus destructor]|nr:Receptor-type tyrosine-protein phosphatase F [Halotydeus destructor]
MCATILPVQTNNKDIVTNGHVAKEPEKVIPFRSRIIAVSELATYIESAVSDGLEAEFKSIPSDATAPCETGKMAENKGKNRYPMYAYDEHRVKLNIEPEDLDRICEENSTPTDYINASYLDGYKQEKRYIATIGPLEHTLVDFWRMAWQTDSKMVVMLCNLIELGKVKCGKYWPDESETYGQFKVTMLETEEFDDFVVRRFSIEKEMFCEKTENTCLTSTASSVKRFPPSVLVNIFRYIFQPYQVIMCEAFMPEAIMKKENLVTDGLAKPEKALAILSHVIPVSELAAYIECSSSNGGWQAEYSSVPYGATAVALAGKTVENKLKNRYEMYAYDEHRVKLAVEAEDLNILHEKNSQPTDYLNASYIDGYKQEKRYIATQAPLDYTLADFWRMTWQTDAKIVVMVCNLVELGKTKCSKYWPDESETYGQYKVTMTEKKEFADYVVRRFSVEKGNNKKQVIQYHYLSWPDNGVPECTGLGNMLKMIRASPEYQLESNPMVVHCSAGVGRTGTFLLIDIMLNMAAAEDNKDKVTSGHVAKEPEKMIPFRSHLVAVSDLAKYIESAVIDGLEAEFSAIPNSVTAPCETGKMAENKMKNRYPVYAYDDHRVKLNIEPEDLDRICEEKHQPTDYINASYIDGYEQEKRYIATIGPLDHTLVDFWRMAWQTDSKMVVMLCNLTELGKTKCGKYWPDESETYGQFKVTMLEAEEFDDFVVRRFSVEKGVDKRHVVQYHFTSWPDQDVPEKMAPLVSFLKKIRSSREYLDSNKPIIFHCSAGLGRTGTLILTDMMLNMAAAENQVDFLKYFCQIRRARYGTIEKYPQYVLCHHALLEALADD